MARAGGPPPLLGSDSEHAGPALLTRAPRRRPPILECHLLNTLHLATGSTLDAVRFHSVPPSAIFAGTAGPYPSILASDQREWGPSDRTVME